MCLLLLFMQHMIHISEYPEYTISNFFSSVILDSKYYSILFIEYVYSGLPNESTGAHPKTWPKMQASTLIRVIL